MNRLSRRIRRWVTVGRVTTDIVEWFSFVCPALGTPLYCLVFGFPKSGDELMGVVVGLFVAGFFLGILATIVYSIVRDRMLRAEDKSAI